MVPVKSSVLNLLDLLICYDLLDPQEIPELLPFLEDSKKFPKKVQYVGTGTGTYLIKSGSLESHSGITPHWISRIEITVW
jgi:hypothetical protein